MQPSTPQQKRVAMSLLTGDRDMEMAESAVNTTPHLYEGIGFHCQQAVEKYLKAVLVSFSMPAPFTHNLVLLMGALQQTNRLSFDVQELADAAVLNEFAVDLHYETDDAPAYTSSDLLAMAIRFQTKLRPLAQAFLI